MLSCKQNFSGLITQFSDTDVEEGSFGHVSVRSRGGGRTSGTVNREVVRRESIRNLKSHKEQLTGISSYLHPITAAGVSLTAEEGEKAEAIGGEEICCWRSS